MDPRDEITLALAALLVLGLVLFVMMRQPWFRRLTSPTRPRRHHSRRRRRPRFRRAA